MFNNVVCKEVPRMESKRQWDSQGPKRKVMKVVHLAPEVEHLLRSKEFTQARVQVRHEGIQVYVSMRSPNDHDEFKPPLQPGEVRLPQHPGDNMPPQRLGDNRHGHHPIDHMAHHPDNWHPQYHGEPAQNADMGPPQRYPVHHRPRNENRPKPIRPAGR